MRCATVLDAQSLIATFMARVAAAGVDFRDIFTACYDGDRFASPPSGTASAVRSLDALLATVCSSGGSGGGGSALASARAATRTPIKRAGDGSATPEGGPGDGTTSTGRDAKRACVEDDAAARGSAVLPAQTAVVASAATPAPSILPSHGAFARLLILDADSDAATYPVWLFKLG